MPGTIQALLFDLDDTLYNRNTAFRNWAQAFARDDLLLAEDDPRYQEAIDQMIELDEWGYGPRETLFRKIKELHPVLQDSVDQLLQTYLQRFIEHIRLEEETQYLLTALKASGFPFGIITNGATSRQLHKIQTLGFDQLTSCIFISEHFGYSKPDSPIFLAAAACLGYETKNILFIGDNPQKDIWGAYQVGMQTAWLHHQREWSVELAETPPDYIIGSLGELCPLLNISRSPSFSGKEQISSN
ncbi:MAG: HAD family hydrolase [Ktedonobacteraceae bacterium]|nr:HAD family hydrolase [Ktedonobacteraceae bacterium]